MLDVLKFINKSKEYKLSWFYGFIGHKVAATALSSAHCYKRKILLKIQPKN